MEILESVQAAEFIELLPNKLDYVVSENGKNLKLWTKTDDFVGEGSNFKS